MPVNKLKNWMTIILVFVLLIVGITVVEYKSRYKFCQESIDVLFETNFAKLCDNLNVDVTDEMNEYELNVINMKYAHVCFSLYSITSYSSNTYMNKIVLSLYNLCEKNELYSTLNSESIDKLNVLKKDLFNEKLAKETFEDITTKYQ